MHPDGKTVIMGGTPDYGYTGGGLLFWDREKRTRVLLTHTDIIPQHSTISLVALPKGKLLGGTTTSPGTGGEKKAKEAELYMMDMASKKLDWHQVVFPGVQEYSDMCMGPKGLIYGIADRKKFFVFDAAKRAVVYERDVAADLGLTTGQQGPRSSFADRKGRSTSSSSKGSPASNRLLRTDHACPIAGSHRRRWRLPRRAHLFCQRLTPLQLQGQEVDAGMSLFTIHPVKTCSMTIRLPAGEIPSEYTG